VQNEKNSQQEEANLTEAELNFARSLEQSLNQALGDGDKVTSIWSRLKPEQRARIADDYLAKLVRTDEKQAHGSFLSHGQTDQGLAQDSDPLGAWLKALDARAVTQSLPTPDTPGSSSSNTDQHRDTAYGDAQTSGQIPGNPKPTAPGQSGTHSQNARTNQYSPPPGYPADFNPLAGFPGLEPSRSGPRPEDIIAGALGGTGILGNAPATPMDVLRGIMPDGYQPPIARQPVPEQPPKQLPDREPEPTQDPSTRTETDADAGPAAPNFWPLWIDQQDILLKQCLKLMSGNMDDAQDALSEAMVKASTKFEDSMDEIRNHRAWLSRIVHNACIDLHRQNRRKAEYREETHGSAETPASPMTAPVIPSPEESFLAGEKIDQLENALLAMQEKLRKPLLMRCVQDRTYDEIADALGLSNCAVRKRVQLAREHLRASGIQ
jgi:RNA polymerase sigma-70 factor (ECF subfamily)